MQQITGESREFRDGEDLDQYEAFEIEEDRDNKWIASLAIDNLEDEDIDIPNNHQLVIDNGYGEVVFNISILTKNCKYVFD